MSSTSEIIVKSFKKFDGNGDGFITRQELANVLQALNPGGFSAQDTDAMLNAVDTNKDGRINYEEFVAWCMTETGDTGTKDQSTDLTKDRIDLDYRKLLPERYEVDITKRYAVDKLTLGEGGYGKVYVAKDKQSGRNVVVKKVVKTGDKQTTQAFRDEIDIMKKLDHPNICKLFATFEEARCIFYVMEFCEGGELFDRIVESGSVTEAFSVEIMSQVCDAIHYAHEQGIAHRDLKPENVVFCTKDKSDTSVKVIDWGLGVEFSGGVMQAAVGTKTYAAPEVITSNNQIPYGPSCDLWSIGVLTYVMLSGKPPFWGNQRQFLKNQMKEQYPMETTNPWPHISAEAKDFIKNLLKADPKKRLKVSECVTHPWLKRKDWPFNEKLQEDVLSNMRKFSNASTFSALCIAAVARQLDHSHLTDVHAVFRSMDKNGDGVLSLEEVQQGFAKIFGESSPECKQVKETFEGMDLDGSHVIDYTEFCAGGLGYQSTARDDVIYSAFKTFDIDNSDSISKEELEKVLGSADVRRSWGATVCDKVASQLLSKFDANGDGSINFQEWMTLMQEEKTKVLMADAETHESAHIKMSINGSPATAYDLLQKVAQL